MAVNLPHIEDSNRTNYFPPKEEYSTFLDDTHYAEKVREWGLSTTKEVKKQFWYKEKTHQRLVTVKGYEIYGNTSEFNTIIIEFEDGNLSCIHPAYLKEMQSANFGKAVDTDSLEQLTPPLSKRNQPPKEPISTVVQKKTIERKEKKEKEPEIILPEEKVHFKAKVKQFAMSWNHFNEQNDEVVILENVIIDQENPITVGLSWCSHSKTLKKFDLVPGCTIEFDGKIVKKKLPKGKDVEEEFIVNVPILYKINNPSKLKGNFNQ